MLRSIELDTSSKHLGINIKEKPGIGIFVSSVTANSHAAEVGISVDDQIVEVSSHNISRYSYRPYSQSHDCLLVTQCGNIDM